MGAGTAVIVGATGLVGQHVLAQAIQEPTYKKIYAIGRTKPNKEHPKLSFIESALDNLEKHGDLFKDADLFCCLGTTIKKAKSKEAFRKVDFAYPLQVAKVGEAMKAASFHCITAIGASSSSAFFYSRVKGELEEELKRTQLPSIHLYHPSLLVGKRSEFRFGEAVSQKVILPFAQMMKGPLKKYRPVKGNQLGQFIIKTAVSGSVGLHIHEGDWF